MPWRVARSPSRCSKGKPFAVVPIEGESDEPLGCHATQQKAVEQVRALYAKEQGAGKQAAESGGGKE